MKIRDVIMTTPLTVRPLSRVRPPLVRSLSFFILFLYPLLSIVNIEYYFSMDSESIQSRQVLIKFEISIILHSVDSAGRHFR